MLNLYPWQQEPWRQLAYRLDDDKVPHAILLSGPAGMGKQHFARYLATSLLCHNPDREKHQPCMGCKSCHLIDAGNHPDLEFLFPAEEGKAIKVDQIRELIGFINLRSQLERYKVVIIDPAESMNRNAANTLLKTLEEPMEQSVLILVSRNPARIPVTIRSRCQTINFKPVKYDQVAEWLNKQVDDASQAQYALELANGAPIECLRMLAEGVLEQQAELITELERLGKLESDPIKIAEKWNAQGAGAVMQRLLHIFYELVSLKASGSVARSSNLSVDRLKRLTNQLDLYRLLLCYDRLAGNNALISSQISYNTQGLLEDFIIYWQSQHK